MSALCLVAGLLLGLGWGLALARELVLAMMRVQAAIERAAASSFFVR